MKDNLCKIISIFLAVLCTSAALSAQPKLREDNIDQVLSAMTLEEKVALLVGDAWAPGILPARRTESGSI